MFASALFHVHLDCASVCNLPTLFYKHFLQGTCVTWLWVFWYGLYLFLVYSVTKIMKSTEVQTLGALWPARVGKRMRSTTNWWAGFIFSRGGMSNWRYGAKNSAKYTWAAPSTISATSDPQTLQENTPLENIFTNTEITPCPLNKADCW